MSTTKLKIHDQVWAGRRRGWALMALLLLGCLFSVQRAAGAIPTWMQVGGDINGEAAGDQSGYSVALSADGNHAAIGAPFNNDETGQVRVYDLVGGTWTQAGGDIDGEMLADRSGWSVALSADGSRVAIGAPFSDHDDIFGAGQVRVYDLVGGTWTQVGADIDGVGSDDQSGTSVAMSADGSRVAIGAPYNRDGGYKSGQVRVFELVTGVWTQVGADIYGEDDSDQSGWSVALSADGSHVAIGSPAHFVGSLEAVGQVRVFQLMGGAWTKVGFDINGEAALDVSGTAVALSADGSRVAIGAPLNDGGGQDAGHVRVYRWQGGVWNQVGADLDGNSASGLLGVSVALSADGNRVAMGGPGIRRSAGQVRVYNLVGRTWRRVGSGLYGQAVFDWSGLSVALSADGSHVASGAPFSNSNGPNSGQVRVFVYQ